MFAGLICTVCLTGCLVYPYHDTYVLGVRHGDGTNVVEKLIQSNRGIACTALLAPCYAGGTTSEKRLTKRYYSQAVSGQRTKMMGLDFFDQQHFEIGEEGPLKEHVKIRYNWKDNNNVQLSQKHYIEKLIQQKPYLKNQLPRTIFNFLKLLNAKNHPLGDCFILLIIIGLDCSKGLRKN